MASIIFAAQNRRTFVRTGALATAAIASGAAFSADGAENTPEGYHLAILSDTHTPADRNNEYRGFKPWNNLKRVVPDIVGSRPEGALINGDAARLTGEIQDYQELKQLLGPLAGQCPVYIGLGNHDHRQNFNQVMQPETKHIADVSNKHVLVIEHPVVRILQLDSLLYVDKVAGLLGKAQRAWLGTFLKEAEPRPTVIFVHHTLGDGDGDLLDSERMFEILKPYPQVKAVFYGHSHRYEYGFREGKHLVNLPAIGYNFNDNQPVGWVDAHFSIGGVHLTLKAIGGNLEKNDQITKLHWG
ncbi:MAG: metallophosphoesterase [Verrucomicrobiota bacterium]|nr:metallophosphoesterase [Verrucomicrobiota bacterium]